MALIVAVEIAGKDVARSSFSAITTATNLNRNGAMLHLNRDLSLDSVLVIKNSRGAPPLSELSRRHVWQMCMPTDWSLSKRRMGGTSGESIFHHRSLAEPNGVLDRYPCTRTILASVKPRKGFGRIAEKSNKICCRNANNSLARSN
jgi:hypothetical protein